jgi:hypothetical protein
MRLTRTSTATNTNRFSTDVLHKTSADMSDGIGSGLTLSVQDDTSAAYPMAAIVGLRSGADATGALALYTYVNGSGFERVRIEPAGSVGIGETVPGAKLHIQGAASAITEIIRANATTPGNLTEWQTSAGTKVLAVTAAGILSSAETAAADLHVKTGTAKTLVLDTVVYKDVYFPQSPPKATGAGNPTIGTVIGNLRGYSYAVNDVHDFDPQEYPHDGVVGGTCHWHIHWLSMTNVAATRFVKWEIEYTYNLAGGAQAATTTSSIEFTIPANTPANTGYLTDIVDWTPANIGPGSIIMVRVKRIAASSTAPADNPFVQGLHFHYPVDTIGSRTETVK